MMQLPEEGRCRAFIDAVLPNVDSGRYPLKRIVGERLAIAAHCYADGHDRLRAVLRWQIAGGAEVYEVEMTPDGDDVWRADFLPRVPGHYRYSVLAWVDAFESWCHDLERREDLADIRIALAVGAALIEDAASRAARDDAEILRAWSKSLRSAADDPRSDGGSLKTIALDTVRIDIARRHADRRFARALDFALIVDRKRAEFSTWYELFPRSSADEAGKHGTFRDVEEQLPELARMGFDVLYFPPIHPIGRVNRKGSNNSLAAAPTDVGSPWAIGAAEGGHKAILPALGGFDEFRSLVARAAQLGIEIALDLAFQCAPDHPYVSAHPQWFRRRPDGSVQYAENPPKKYQDIYPFDFETDDWRELWRELKSVVDFWIERGVKIFRVDNPHTKAFGFWRWLIDEVKREHADVIFLAEAFTRPKLMLGLAKLGFTQSYTYFTWRNSKRELTAYFSELSTGPSREYYRPNLWPNTPDILPEPLQSGLRPVFAARLVLAATLSGNYGIYGPSYELMVSAAREAGSEEYLDSEKYQLRHWQESRPDSLRSLIARVNRARRENPALQSNRELRFCPIDNEQLIAYLKHDAASGNVVITVVNLDPVHVQSGWLELDLEQLRLDPRADFQVHDLLSDQRFLWRGPRNYVALDPVRMPAHVLRLRHRVRREHDFDYFL
jgi:starch synthase (maltosyl-transferring)